MLRGAGTRVGANAASLLGRVRPNATRKPARLAAPARTGGTADGVPSLRAKRAP